MPLIERVAEIREKQRKTGIRVSEEEALARGVAREAQKQAKAANLEAYIRFVQTLGLKKSLKDLAEAEKLKNPTVGEIIKEPVAALVELRLTWQGTPKRKSQETVILGPQRGFFSISITWAVDGNVTVSGDKVFGSFHASLLDYGSYMEDFEESIAKSYLNPRWNEKPYQLMFAEEKSAPGF